MAAVTQVTPYKRPILGIFLLVTSLLLRYVGIYADALVLGWYWGSLLILYRGQISFNSIIDYMGRFSSYPQVTQIRFIIDIMTLLASIIVLFALSTKSRKLLRYSSLSLLLPLTGNIVLTLTINQPAILSFWFNLSSNGLSIRFGDFLMAVSAIIFFKASGKRPMPVPQPPPTAVLGPKKMSRCSKCGATIPDEVIFCSNCGIPRRTILLSTKRIYLIPIIISTLLITASVYSFINPLSYTVYARKVQSTGTGGGGSGYRFYVRTSQVLTLSFQVDTNSSSVRVYVAKADGGEYGAYPNTIQGLVFWEKRSGHGEAMVPSYGEYTLVIIGVPYYGKYYISMDIELRATVFSYIEIAAIFLISLLFLFLYWTYFPKIEVKSLMEKKIESELA